MSDIKGDIKQFVVENFLFGQDDGLQDEDSFLERGIIDSTGVLELVAHIEETYGFKVDDADLIPENLDSIKAVADFISSKKTG